MLSNETTTVEARKSMASDHQAKEIHYYNYNSGTTTPLAASWASIPQPVRERIIQINQSLGRLFPKHVPATSPFHFKIHHLGHSLQHTTFSRDFGGGKTPFLVDELGNKMHFFMTGRVAKSTLHTGHAIDFTQKQRMLHTNIAELFLHTFQIDLFRTLLRNLGEKVVGNLSVQIENGGILFSTFYNEAHQVPIFDALDRFDMNRFDVDCPKITSELHTGSSVVVGFTVYLHSAKEHQNCVGFAPEFVCLLCEDFDAEAEEEDDAAYQHVGRFLL
ncbi:hypothetical protein HDU99_007764 [Rhizoclosmatium hyalinum]|nr:hypothetical protein HDU99_007764 [Rhizoclosmatium hyalinum]